MTEESFFYGELKDFLEEKVIQYNHPSFIESDPISIPHLFSSKEDREIAGFLAATISWGNRKSIIQNARKMLNWLDNAPFDFIINHTEADLDKIEGVVHRTFNSDDLRLFIRSLQNIYANYGGLEAVFGANLKDESTQPAINVFRQIFFSIPHLPRSTKHVSDPFNGSSAKRINMYLRWMVRNDRKGVDFGIWQSIPPSYLSCPLDIHSGNVARKLGLLSRKQNDAKAVKELDKSLRLFDPIDPTKYDFALFGLGVFEKY
ncbi:TIGR02757 family protein [Peijinzhouia sedimentorum]